MKNGSFKQLVGEFMDEAIASSDIVTKLCTSIHTVALEAKSIAETVHMLIERLEAHEKILIQLCALAEKQSESTVEFSHRAKNKETPKPN